MKHCQMVTSQYFERFNIPFEHTRTEDEGWLVDHFEETSRGQKVREGSGTGAGHHHSFAAHMLNIEAEDVPSSLVQLIIFIGFRGF